MKKLLLAITVLTLVTTAIAQDCFWLKGGGGGTSNGKDIATDIAGNVISVGNFYSPSITFGGTSYNNTFSGSNDFYLVKYDSLGTVLWAKVFGGTGVVQAHEEIESVTIDASNNIFVAGSFASSKLIMGDDTLVNASGGSYATFIAKLDEDGNMIWAKTTGGSRTSDDRIFAITTDGSGKLYVTGRFHSSTIIFGGDTLTKMTSSGSDVFIAKYDTSGNAIWAVKSGGKGIGNFDVGNGIAANTSAVYVTGFYDGDKFYFGPDSIQSTTNTNFFVLKCDTAGNFIWARSGENTDSYGSGIAIDASGDCYVSGYFQNGTLNIDTTTITNDGGYDVFILKYLSSGILSWTLNASGGSYDDRAFSIHCDGTGNVHVSGNFIGTNALVFGPVTLSNSNSMPSAGFVLSLNSNGTPQSGFCTKGSGSSYFRSVTTDSNGRLYFTGEFSSNVYLWGNNTQSNSLTNSGQTECVTGRTYVFDVTITVSTSNCFSGTTGTASANVTGGVSPFTYLWQPGNITTSVANNLPAGYDTLWVTDALGCQYANTVIINQPTVQSPSICMVTVDSASQHNIITWDKTSFTNVDSFIVYREITTNNYQPIGRIHFDSLSQFVDTVQTLYFPNTGNPNNGTYRYKINAHDSCGTYSIMSAYHNTIFILNSNGSFYWTQPYSGNTVSSYELLRDDYSTGNWQIVTSVSGTQQIITDPLYSIFQGTGSWRVKTVWGVTCNPTMKTTSSFNTSLSNIITNTSVGTGLSDSENVIIVAPNPATEIITISSSAKIQSVEIRNILGELVYSERNNGNTSHIKLDVSSYSSGIYFIQLKSSTGTITKKIIKE